MNLGYVIVYVENVADTLSFYERCFGLVQRGKLDGGGQYGEMETGTTRLAFASEELAASNFDLPHHRNIRGGIPAGFELALVTADVKGAFGRAVESGAMALAEPKLKPWGQEVAYVRDLNGVIVELASPMT